MLPELGLALSAFFCLCQVLVVSEDTPCGVTILGNSTFYVEHGGSQPLNCTTSCEDAVSVDYETSLKKEGTKAKGRWASTTLVNITAWESFPICYVIRENGKEAKTEAAVIAYRPPRNVSISVPGVMEANRSYPVTCRLSSVAPLGKARVTILRGGEALHVENFENSTRIEGADEAVTHHLTAQESDHGEVFSCLVELDLRPHGKLFSQCSSNVTVRIFAFPEVPEIQVASYIQKGSEVAAQCQVSGVFPAEEVTLTLAFDGELLNSTGNRTDKTVTAEARVTPTESGEYPLECTANLGDLSRNARKLVYVYNFPDPALQVSELNTKAGNDLTIRCSLAGAEPDNVQMEVTLAGAPLSCPEGAHFQRNCTLTAQREHHGEEVACQARLTVLERVIPKRTSARLNVAYIPEFSSSGCPAAQMLVEGGSGTIRCQAEGNPAPLVECTRHGETRPDEGRKAARADSGTHTCRATNSEGSVARNVTVVVEYGPTISDIEVRPKDTMKKGDNITLRCLASGLPPPEYRWSVPDQRSVAYSPDNATLAIHNAQTHHSGVYTCEVTNGHGNHALGKEIRVTDPLHTLLAAIFGTVAGCVVVTAAVCYYVYYRAQKIRKYKLQQARKSGAGKSLVPNGENHAAP
ncbi:intercellular adhesion molecule 5 [Rhinatrema bivittatum]|uniref:intercellular adhesion molecule 5 n=1 Tax=Rhinatrema bivittatum TaxID=194408 RepID=UPI00112D48C8|nr:intercellular adhesion molecule 5 [Rhinatrema bivittatum]